MQKNGLCWWLLAPRRDPKNCPPVVKAVPLDPPLPGPGPREMDHVIPGPPISSDALSARVTSHRFFAAVDKLGRPGDDIPPLENCIEETDAKAGLFIRKIDFQRSCLFRAFHINRRQP